MAVNDTSTLAVQGTVNGQTHIHDLSFRSLFVGGPEQQIIDDWQAGCRTAYRALFSTDDDPCETYSVRHVCGSLPLRATVEETEVAPNIAGSATKSGNREPSFVAALASTRTAFAGRSRRGRFFIGGLYDGDLLNTGQALASGYTTLMEAYAAALLTVFGPSGSSSAGRLVVYSPTLAALGGDCTTSATSITAIAVSPNSTTMRSRKLGHGA